MFFTKQDRMPLPCGSIESALLTMEEKAAIGDKVLALDRDIDYAGEALCARSLRASCFWQGGRRLRVGGAGEGAIGEKARALGR